MQDIILNQHSFSGLYLLIEIAIVITIAEMKLSLQPSIDLIKKNIQKVTLKYNILVLDAKVENNHSKMALGGIRKDKENLIDVTKNINTRNKFIYNARILGPIFLSICFSFEAYYVEYVSTIWFNILYIGSGIVCTALIVVSFIIIYKDSKRKQDMFKKFDVHKDIYITNYLEYSKDNKEIAESAAHSEYPEA